MPITDTEGNECTQQDWDALWDSFAGDSEGERLLFVLMGVLTHPEMVRTLCGMKQRESGQAYLNGLALNYNYFRPHQALAGKKPAESAGAVIPFESWRDVASMTEAS